MYGQFLKTNFAGEVFILFCFSSYQEKFQKPFGLTDFSKFAFFRENAKVSIYLIIACTAVYSPCWVEKDASL